MAWVIRRLIWSCSCIACKPHLLGSVGIDRGGGEDLHRPAAQVARGRGLALQVGGSLGHDLLDLGALRVAGVEAVEHVVDHPAHVLGRPAHHPRAAHAAMVHALHPHRRLRRRRRRLCPGRDADRRQQRQHHSHHHQPDPGPRSPRAAPAALLVIVCSSA
jgi:hypothetical protein